MGILVEWASWWNGHLGGMGILVEWASWWNGHLARYNLQTDCPNTGYRENEGEPFGGALRGGVSQRWLRGEKSEAFRP
ncbi:hypothetical protein BJP34_29470 [Moorena producens PAL-8-15-08-1]|uniref:Uncharacterized protein n=1 Tax=Moorena producens PAL-8-15-08-1 TaxID=1458985 RepID=A0A1D8TZL6_9CYAN|nr:hypothetical protein [Moorena producens]AOX03025.1 hypothetical protein BJP34_29470 [Moorena producens PAL-8-15-08-1]